jgi:Ca-activated chloride channel family protein
MDAGAEYAEAEMPAEEPAAMPMALAAPSEPEIEEGQELLPPDARLGRPDEFNTEAYDRIYENPFLLARDNPLSTFSIDVDTASYANTRRFLKQSGRLPPRDAVRIEELINYFTYDYQPPGEDMPFSAHVEIAPCPWNPEHKLARIGLKGQVIEEDERPEANLVFLLDVSGSMDQPNKLPLLKTAMRMLVQNLTDRDRVAIVVYASASGVVLPPTSCETKEPILAALERLKAGGSTAGSEGIQLAYNVVQQYYSPDSVNRVILCTDGDFNVGITDQGELVRLIEDKARSGVFLSVLGFGMGNYKDSTMEKLADKGNGNYAYIDTILEARKVLVDQLGGTLVTIAKDVKIQVDFNPTHVGAYRLIGYENRMLRAEDFRDDTKDAGEIGAGHTVTALYQLVPAGLETQIPQAEPSKYQKGGEPTEAAESDEVLTLRLRYKAPAADASEEVSFPVTDPQKSLEDASGDFKFAAAVAGFGMLLRDSQHKGAATYDLVVELAQAGKGEDPSWYRGEFIQLVKTAQALAGK